MPLWHCPHCGTPQPEAARCWVCRKSSTTCVTCRHYRHGVAASLGYCGLDRRRDPLRGDELRGCWEASPATVTAALGIGARTSEVATTGRSPLAWREVATPGARSESSPARMPARGDASEAAVGAGGTPSGAEPTPSDDGSSPPGDGRAPSGAGRPDRGVLALWGDLEF